MSKNNTSAEGAPKKKSKLMIVLAVIGILLVLGIIMKLTGIGTNPASGTQSQSSTSEIGTSAEESNTTADSAPEDSAVADTGDEQSYTLEYGELVSATVNDFGDGPVLVVKAKISSSYNNDATIDQNYYNVEDLIQNQSCTDFYEIQYWAVADMSNDSEEKVVSFTVNAELIQQIADGSVPANKLGDYVTDLFIHSSLED